MWLRMGKRTTRRRSWHNEVECTQEEEIEAEERELPHLPMSPVCA